MIWVHPSVRIISDFRCSNSSQQIHFKFERFNTEPHFDYLIIGELEIFDFKKLENANYFINPHYSEYDYYDAYYFDSWNYWYSSFEDICHESKNLLILDGFQETGEWFSAEGLSSLLIFFLRNMFMNWICDDKVLIYF